MDFYKKPSTARKIAYTLPSLAFGAFGVLAALLANLYTNPPLAVTPTFLATVVFLASLGSTITNIFVGYLSDRLRWNFGRRRPFVVVCFPLVSLSAIGLYAPQVEGDSAAPWFALFYVVYQITSRLLDQSLSAFRLEVTRDPIERISLFTYNAVFSVSGSFLASGLTILLPGQFALSGIIVTSIFFISILIFVFVARENKENWRDPVPIVPAIRMCLTNRPWKQYLGSNILVVLLGSGNVLLPFLFQYVFLVDQNLWFGIYAGGYAAASVLISPIWQQILKKVDKVKCFKYVQVFGVSYGVILLVSTHTSIYVLFAALLVVAVWASGVTIIESVLLNDIVDYDELVSGKRREATYVAVTGLPGSFLSSIGTSLPLLMLDEFGFVTDSDTQNSKVLDVLRYYPAVFPIAVSIAAAILMWNFPITNAVHRKIVKAIEDKKHETGVLDPVTGFMLRPDASFFELEPLQDQDEEKEDGDEHTRNLNTDWLKGYFSDAELSSLSRHGSRAFEDILKRLYFSIFCWASIAGICIWQGAQFYNSEQQDIGIAAIYYASVILFMFLFDCGRVPIIRRILLMHDLNDAAFIIRFAREQEKFNSDDDKSLFSTLVDSNTAQSTLSVASLVFSEDSVTRRRKNNRETVLFFVWKIIAFIPAVIFMVLQYIVY